MAIYQPLWLPACNLKQCATRLDSRPQVASSTCFLQLPVQQVKSCWLQIGSGLVWVLSSFSTSPKGTEMKGYIQTRPDTICRRQDLEKKKRKKKRKEKTTPFGVNLMRSQVLYRAAQGQDILLLTVFGVLGPVPPWHHGSCCEGNNPRLGIAQHLTDCDDSCTLCSCIAATTGSASHHKR